MTDNEASPAHEPVPDDEPIQGMDDEAERSADRRSDSDRTWASASLAILAGLGFVYSIYFARAVLMPLVMACIITLLFRPVVHRVRRYRIPDSVSAAFILLGVMLVFVVTAANLVVPAREWAENAPAHMQVVGEKLAGVRKQLQQISAVSDRVREIAEGDDDKEGDDKEGDEDALATGGELSVIVAERSIWETAGAVHKRPIKEDRSDTRGEDRPIQVEVRQPRLLTGIAFLSSTGGLLAGVVVTMVLSYFLLATGDRLLNNTLQLMPSFRDRRNLVEMIHEVEDGISSYLLTVSLINLGLGVVIGVALWSLGVPNPALWGAMACVLNFIPYLGAITGTVIVFLVAVYSFDSLAYASVIPVVYLLVTAVEGNFVTPMLLGRQMSLSPVMVFLALVFWGWMWGIGGVLLAVPILTITKIVLEQFERTQPASALLSG